MASYSDSLLDPASSTYDSGHFAIELSAVPASRAPSYFSSKERYWRGDVDDNNDGVGYVSLVRHAAPMDKADDVQIHVQSTTSTTRLSRIRTKKFKGWRFGVAVSAWLAVAALTINTILTIAAVAAIPETRELGVGTIFEGECKDIDSKATWLHVLINAVSSLLLSASNYTMQCLCAPTREEVDRAHAKGEWMDIGVSSVRNIFKISRLRTCLWWLLGVSSIPIHLLYNSAVFKSIDANEYQVVVATPDFLKYQPFNADVTLPVDHVQPAALENYTMPSSDYQIVQLVQGLFANDSAYLNSTLVQNLTNSECISAYSPNYVTGRSHVVAITSTPSNITNQTVHWEEYMRPSKDGSPEPYSWVCMDSTGDIWAQTSSVACDPTDQAQNATEWTVGRNKIDYCLSYIEPGHCAVQVSVYILVAVIVMNACKAACMFTTLYRTRHDPLVTIGDALASFLDSPDELTKDRCLMDRADVHAGPLRWSSDAVPQTPGLKPLATSYSQSRPRRWFAAASKRRWIVTTSLCAAALGTAAGLLGPGVKNIDSYPDSPGAFHLGFGAVDARAVISAALPLGGTQGLVTGAILVNTPQAIVSFLYLTYNGLLTSMLLSQEYSKYGIPGRRRPLRVTTPHGQQRSSHYLQLPLRYSIPLLVVAGLLHWLISESIFVVRVDVYASINYYVNSPGAASTYLKGAIAQVGYSCPAILCAVLLGAGMLLTALGLGCRRFASAVPVAGSCSVAISAAAHRPAGDIDAAFLPVSWGEPVAGTGLDDIGDGDVGHACFTSEEVRGLVDGRLYAGVRSTGLQSAEEGEGESQMRRRVDGV